MRIESLGSRGLSACAADVHNRAWLFHYGRWRQFTVTIAVTLYQVVLHRNRQFFAYSATHIGGALPRVLIIGEVCSVGRFCKIVEGSVARACNRSPLFVAPTANG